MSKVICDICGTAYQETADNCPICGYSRILGVEELSDGILEEETILTRNKGGRFAQSNVRRKNKEIFDYDEVNPEEDEDEDEDEEDYDEEDYVQQPRSNTGIIIVLVVVIMLLLAVSGFLFLRFFVLSDKDSQTVTTAATIPTETQTEATTEPTIPCQSIVLTGGMAELNKEGQFYLLNVKVMPEDTTDTLTYTSEDESIATVTVDGRVTAVSEGETTIYITCGKQQINCPVIVKFVEETEPPTEETVDATAETVDSTEETVSETEGSQEEITLKLKKYDISLTVGFGATLILDCDLEPGDVEWSVEHDYIATVDENGFVKAVGYGTTAVIVRYGDQQVQCIVRCK